MSLTRQHFIAIAETLKDCKPSTDDRPCCLSQWELTVRHICRTVGRYNSNFDYDRFMSACGYEESVL